MEKDKMRRSSIWRLTVAAMLVFSLVFTLPVGAGMISADAAGSSAMKAGQGSVGVSQSSKDVSASAVAIFTMDSGVSAFATKKVKVTWNANGGKIGSKTKVSTKVTKGKKLGKLKTAKRSGYTFKGWYTKESGGKKVTKNTKIKKNTTLYAQWTRKLNSTENKLVGTWGVYWDGGTVYRFYKDGTYIMYAHFSDYPDMRARGFWSIENGMLTKVAQWSTQTNKDTEGYFEEFGYVWTPWGEFETAACGIRFGIDHNSFEGKECFDEIYADREFSLQTDRYIRDRIGSVPDGV